VHRWLASHSDKASRSFVVVRNVLPCDGAVHHVASAGHHGLLVDVETGAMRIKHFHGSPPEARRLGIPFKEL
jgi:hypothetical protein